MTVGNQASANSINNSATTVAVTLRNVMEQVTDLATYVSTLGTGGLEAIGFSSEDAGTLSTLTAYMSTVAGCYYGTVQQGGSGGTGAVQFDFNNALSVLWGGQ